MSDETKAVKTLYWDANVFLTLINEKPVDRLPVIKAILDDCDDNNVEIFTSLLTITEVAYAQYEKQRRILDPTAEEKIDKLWSPPSPIKLIDIHQFVVHDAKNLMRAAITKGWSLRPADAIHLASAKRMNIAEFQTYEPALKKYSDLTGFAICEPNTDRFAFSGPKQ